MVIFIKASGETINLGEDLSEFQSRQQAKRIAERGLTSSERASLGSSADVVQKQSEAIAKLPVSEQQTIFSTGKFYGGENGRISAMPIVDTQRDFLSNTPYGPVRPELLDKARQQESFVSLKNLSGKVAETGGVMQQLYDYGSSRASAEARLKNLEIVSNKNIVKPSSVEKLKKIGGEEISYVKGGVKLLELPFETLKSVSKGVSFVGEKTRSTVEKVGSKLPEFKGAKINFRINSLRIPSKEEVLKDLTEGSKIGEAALKYPLEKPVSALIDFETGRALGATSEFLGSKISALKDLKKIKVGVKGEKGLTLAEQGLNKLPSSSLRGIAKGSKIGVETTLGTLYGLDKLQEGAKEYSETGSFSKTAGESLTELGLFSLGARSVTESKEALLKKYGKEIENLPSYQQKKINELSLKDLKSQKFVERLEKARISTIEKEGKVGKIQLLDTITKLSKAKNIKPQKVIPLKGKGLISKEESGIVIEKGFEALGSLKKGEAKIFTGREGSKPELIDFSKETYFPNLGKKISVTKQFGSKEKYYFGLNKLGKISALKTREQYFLKEPLTYLRSLPEKKVSVDELSSVSNIPKSSEKVFTFADLEPYKRARKVIGKSVKSSKPKKFINIDKMLEESQLKQITKQVSVSKPVTSVKNIETSKLSVLELTPKKISGLKQSNIYRLESKQRQEFKPITKFKEITRPITEIKPISRNKIDSKPISLIKNILKSETNIKPVSSVREIQKLKQEQKPITKFQQLQKLKEGILAKPKPKEEKPKDVFLFSLPKINKMFKHKAKKKGKITPQLQRFTPTLFGSGKQPSGKIFYIGGESR